MAETQHTGAVRGALGGRRTTTPLPACQWQRGSCQILIRFGKLGRFWSSLRSRLSLTAPTSAQPRQSQPQIPSLSSATAAAADTSLPSNAPESSVQALAEWHAAVDDDSSTGGLPPPARAPLSGQGASTPPATAKATLFSATTAAAPPARLRRLRWPRRVWWLQGATRAGGSTDRGSADAAADA